jgi:hypothetical protein
MSNELKAFLIYAYAFIFVYMFNSLLLLAFIKLSLPPFLFSLVGALTMGVALFLTYRWLSGRYFGVRDGRRVLKGWLYQFLPFIVLSALLLFLSFSLVKSPNLAIFIYLNLAVGALYLTFKFSLKKLLEES